MRFDRPVAVVIFSCAVCKRSSNDMANRLIVGRRSDEMPKGKQILVFML